MSQGVLRKWIRCLLLAASYRQVFDLPLVPIRVSSLFLTYEFLVRNLLRPQAAVK